MKKRITFIVSIILIVGSFIVTTYHLNHSSSGDDYSTPTPTVNIAIGTPTPAPTAVPTPTPTAIPSVDPTATPTPTPIYEDVFADTQVNMALTLTYSPIDIASFPGVTFVSSDDTIATVDETCLLTGVAQGVVTISALDGEGNTLDQLEVTVHPFKLYDNGYGYSIGYYSGRDENLIIPDNFAGKPVTIITRGVFQHHTELKTVIVPDTVEEMRQYTFQGCTSLYYVKLSEKLKTIGNCSFYGCSSLVEITIPDSVTSLGSLMFQNCYSLKTVNLGKNTSSIGPYTFDGCTALTDVTIGIKLGTSGFNDIFNSASMNLPVSLVKVDVSADNPYLMSHDGVVYNKWLSKLLFYPYGKTDEKFYASRDLLIVDTYSIANNPYIKTIDLPTKCTQINDNGIFGCTALTTVSSSGIQQLGASVFAGCTELSDINFGDKIISIGERCFSSCTKLKAISLGKGLVSIGENAFELTSSDLKINYAGSDVEWQAIKGYEYLAEFSINYAGGVLITPTPAPSETPTPEVTPAPEFTPVPETTPDTDVTPAPESTPVPEITPEPEITPAPELTPVPEITPEPAEAEV